mmetsp:Transcript_12981/g.21214  ORF Transcript_12981/g.21214 Transcript_12981/m.21214 type:complete len:287 (-) Transcript_12981:1474-2334(-)
MRNRLPRLSYTFIFIVTGTTSATSTASATATGAVIGAVTGAITTNIYHAFAMKFQEYSSLVTLTVAIVTLTVDVKHFNWSPSLHSMCSIIPIYIFIFYTLVIPHTAFIIAIADILTDTTTANVNIATILTLFQRILPNRRCLVFVVSFHPHNFTFNDFTLFVVAAVRHIFFGKSNQEPRRAAPTTRIDCFKVHFIMRIQCSRIKSVILNYISILLIIHFVIIIFIINFIVVDDIINNIKFTTFNSTAVIAVVIIAVVVDVAATYCILMHFPLSDHTRQLISSRLVN